MGKRDTLPKYCQACPYLKMCWGECPKNRIVRAPDGEAGLNYPVPGHQSLLQLRRADAGGISHLNKRDYSGLKR